VIEQKPMTIVVAPQFAATPPAKENAAVAVAAGNGVGAVVVADDAAGDGVVVVAAAATDEPKAAVAVTYSPQDYDAHFDVAVVEAVVAPVVDAANVAGAVRAGDIAGAEGVVRVGGNAGNDDEDKEGEEVGVAVTTPDVVVLASADLAASYHYEDSRSPTI